MQMTRQAIIDELKSILISTNEQHRALAEQCTADTRLVEDFGFSSVEMLYMVISIEETFGIRFDDGSMGDFSTLGTVVDYIEAHLA